MKHLINDRLHLIEDMIDGLVAAYGGSVEKVGHINAIVKKNIKDGKIALLVGGGSGHEPIYRNYSGIGFAS